MNRYTVVIHDRAGLYERIRCADFATARDLAPIAKARHPDKHVRVENEDRIDLGCEDGLSEEEKYELGDQ